jgi:hypothetical protein
LAELNEQLVRNPRSGTALGNDAYKIRLAIKSKGNRKSGGVRIITYVVTKDQEVYLLTIYDKAEIEIVEDKTLKKIIDELKKNKNHFPVLHLFAKHRQSIVKPYDALLSDARQSEQSAKRNPEH